MNRNDWSAKPATRVTPLHWPSVRYAVLHWPASMGAKIGSDRASVARWLRAWQLMHMNDRGWSDIAYSHAVDLAGRRWTLRGWDRQEGGVENMGGQCVSVLAVVGSKDEITPELRAAVVEWQREADKRAGHKLKRTYHGALKSTACPGPDLTRWARAGFPINNQEDEMPTPEDVWKADVIPAPEPIAATGNKSIKASSSLVIIERQVRETVGKVTELSELIMAMANKVLTPEEIAAAAQKGAEQALADRIRDAQITLEVGQPD